MAKGYDYDVIVIGAGIAGMVSAVTATGLGKRVAVVEKRLVGGNCTNFTCIPSKTLVRLAHSARDLARLGQEGVLKPTSFEIDTGNVLSRIRSVVEKAYSKDTPDTFEEIGIRIISGQASLVDRHRITVKGKTISARYFILAVGTRPLVPPLPGISDVGYLTNENLYELDAFPKSLVILGGGVDGLEYGSAFGRLGVETTVIQRGKRLLPTADRELVNRLSKALQDDGIRLMTGTKAVGLRRTDRGRAILDIEREDGSVGTVEAERILVALGRTPDLEGLGLENAGVDVSPKGILTDKTLRTSAPNIYACGDIVGPDQLASMAEYQGIVAATNAILPVKQKVDYRSSVYVIFTEPPLAYIGLTEEQAHARYGHKLAVYRFDYAQMRRALIDGHTTGLAKFLCDGRGRLVGVHILGEAAGEVIHEAQVIKAMKKPLHRLNLVTHAYPTYAQALVGRASQLAFLDRMGSSFFVNAGLRLLPGFDNRLSLARERLAEVHAPQQEKTIGSSNVIMEADTYKTAETAIETRCLGDRACIVEMPEHLMDHDERPFVGACAWNNRTDQRHVVLNFAPVRAMNGLGASMLVKLSARAQIKGQVLSAFGAGKDLLHILHLTDLDQVIELYDSETQALSALGLSADRLDSEEQAKSDFVTTMANWTEATSELSVVNAPKEARNLNVIGRRAIGPVKGFGRLWQKIFRLHIPSHAATPEEAVAALKEHFHAFQPPFNRFYPLAKGISPGAIVLIDSITPGGPVSTGVMVLYADERSFTFNTPEGHPECGFVSFSAREENDRTIIEILGLARASDPIYEAAFRLAGSRIQTRIWRHVLTSLALHFGVPATITVEQECVDPWPKWSRVGNAYQNAQVRTLLHEPKRWFRRL